MVKKKIRLPMQEIQETWVQSLGCGDSLQEKMAIHSNIFAWKIPWTEEPGRPQSMRSQRVRHYWASGRLHITHLILTMTLQGRCYYYSHLTNEETEIEYKHKCLLVQQYRAQDESSVIPNSMLPHYMWICDWIMAPKDIHFLVPGICQYYLMWRKRLCKCG